MDRHTQELLRTIIGDSVIIDIDMTKWSKYISIIVISDHMMSNFSSKRKGLFEIKFISIYKFETIFYQDNNINDASDNIVWRTHDCDLIIKKEFVEISIYQMKDMPKINIRFKNVEINELSHEYIIETFPDLYNGLNSYFVRPNIETIYTSYSIKKR